MQRLRIYSDDGEFEIMLATNKQFAVNTVIHMSPEASFVVGRVHYDAESFESWYEAMSDLPRSFFISNGYKEVLPCSTNSNRSSTAPQQSQS